MGSIANRCLALTSAVLALSTLTPALHAQASPSALRGTSLEVYGATSLVNTDYNARNTGYLVGGDFTHHYRFLNSALDLRFNKSTGSVVGQKSFLGGLKLDRRFGRVHPYADFLVGYGVVTFNTPGVKQDGTPLTYDDSVVKNIGGGLDYQLTKRFGIKLDGQYQMWKLGLNQPLTPMLMSVGVTYHLPYRYLRPRAY